MLFPLYQGRAGHPVSDKLEKKGDPLTQRSARGF
jgi:hypothetical protein